MCLFVMLYIVEKILMDVCSWDHGTSSEKWEPLQNLVPRSVYEVTTAELRSLLLTQEINDSSIMQQTFGSHHEHKK
jgi:hypothetical protein